MKILKYLTLVFCLTWIGCAHTGLSKSETQDATVEAIATVLQRTTFLNDAPQSFGAVFLNGVDRKTVNLLSVRYAAWLPRIDRDLRKLDVRNYVDKETGKEALLLEVKITSTTVNSCNFRIVKEFGSLGSSEYFVDMTRLNGKWIVSLFKLGAQS